MSKIESFSDNFVYRLSDSIIVIEVKIKAIPLAVRVFR